MFMETEIDLVNNKECFTIWLSSKDKKDFELSFDEIFSGKKVQGTPLDCKPKTTEQLIDCYGYPIYKCIRNGKENWYYNLGFVGREIDGFHDCWVEVKDGRVLGFWGHL